MAIELEGLECTLHFKADKTDVENVKKLMVSMVDSATIKNGFSAMENGLKSMSVSADKGLKTIQALTAINAKGFKDLTEVTGSLINKMQELEKQTEKSAESTSKNVKKAVEETKESVDGIDNLIEKAAGYVGGYFALDFAKGQISKVMDIRSQFMSIEKGLGVVLQSEEKGKKMFEDIKQFAIDTPMDMKGIASTAQMMLGFGIPAEQIMDNLKALGDVAMGDNNKFHSLALAFSQMSAAGKLMGGDLLQMINAGFNPLQTIADQTGKKIGELKEEMSAGLISADRVRQAFLDASNEGGRFHGMMQAQATTISGNIEKLNDAMDALYNTIGEKTEKYIIGVIGTLGDMVENWQEVLKILGELIVTYGLYKTTLIAIQSAQKASIVAERALAIARKQSTLATKSATTAHIMFNNALNGLKGGVKSVLAMINPWTLVAVAIAGASYAIYKVVTAETEAEKAAKKLNSITENYTSELTKEQKECDKLFGKLTALNKESKKYAEVKNQILGKYGAYLKNLTEEEKSLNNIAGAYLAITKAIKDKWKAQALDKAETEFTNATEEKQLNIMKSLFEDIENNKVGSIYKSGNRNVFVRKRDRSDLEKAAFEESIADYFNKMTMALEDQARWYDVDKNGEAAYKLVFDKIWGDFVTYGETSITDNLYKDGKNMWGLYVNEYFKVWKENRKALSKARIMFQHDEVIPTDEDKPKPPENKTKPLTEDPTIKKIEEEKKKIKERMKASQELVGMHEEWKAQEKKITDPMFGEKISDEVAAKMRSSLSDKHSIRTEKILASNTTMTKDDVAAVKKVWEEYSSKSYEEAKKEYPALLQKLSKLQKDMEVKAEKMAKKKSEVAGNADKQKENKKHLSELEALTAQSIELQTAVSTLENILDRGADANRKDYSNKISAYTEYMKRYSDIVRDTTSKLKDATTNKQREDILIDNSFQVESLKQDFREQFGEEIPEDIMDAVGKAIGMYANMTIGEIDKIILAKRMEIDKLKKDAALSGEDLSQQISEAESALEDLLAERDNKVSKRESKYDKTIKNVRNLTGEFKKLGQAIGGDAGESIEKLADVANVAMSFADSVKNFTETATKCMQKSAEEASAAIKAVEMSTAILAIIGAVIALGRALNNLFNDNSMSEYRKEIRELRREMRAYADELEYIHQINSKSNIFGTDNWGILRTNISEAVKAQKKYNDLVEYGTTIQANSKEAAKEAAIFWTKVASGQIDVEFGTLEYYEKQRDYVYNAVKDNGGSAPVEDYLKNMDVTIKKRNWLGSAFGMKDKKQKLGDAVPELFDKNGNLDMEQLEGFIGSDTYKRLSEDNQMYLSDMVESWKRYKDSLEEVKQGFSNFFGGLGQSITDMFVNSFKTGISCVDDFKNAWNQAVESMVTSMLYSKIIQPIFDNLQVGLEEIGFFNNADEETINKGIEMIMAAGDEVYGQKDLVNKTLESWRAKMGLYNDSTRTGLTGGINSMSQDTAEELNGRMTQIQSHTFSLNEQCVAMRQISESQLVVLQGIKTDTARLEGIEKSITSLDKNIKDIQIMGLKIK